MYLADVENLDRGFVGQSIDYDELIRRAQPVAAPASAQAATAVTKQPAMPTVFRPAAGIGLGTYVMVGLGALALLFLWR